MRVVGLTIVAAAAYLVAVIYLDFLRIDACLDLGGSWNREAEACAVYGMSIRSVYPTWVYGLSGAASIMVFVTACASLAVACMGRWELARRLGRRSVVAGLGTWIVTIALAMTAVTSGVFGAASKATLLGKTISDFMNSTVAIYPGVLLGGGT